MIKLSIIIIFFFIFALLSLFVFIFVCFIRAYKILKNCPVQNIYIKKMNDSDFCHYKEFPPSFEKYLLQVEDSNFYTHKGFDIKAIIRATIKNIIKKKIVMGGSTITQQLAKNLYLESKRTFYRKITELFIALNIEKKLSKIEILELYLTIIYFGDEQYGIKNASKYFFNKEFKNLSKNQSFILITLISSPNKLNPTRHKESFIRVRNKKLKRVQCDKSEEKDLELIRSYTIDNLDPELVKTN